RGDQGADAEGGRYLGRAHAPHPGERRVPGAARCAGLPRRKVLLAGGGTGRRQAVAPLPGHAGREKRAQPRGMNCGSTSMRSPSDRRLVWLARPTTAISSMNIASLMPFLRAAAVCEKVQYSQPLVTLTAR